MTSNLYNQTINNSFFGQSNYTALNGTQTPAKTYNLPQASMLSYATPSIPASDAQWSTLEDLHLSSDAYVNFESAVFQSDEDSSSTVSSLHNASKKITKISSEGNTKQSSQKRSKRARNPWTPQEDAQLMELMKKYGQSWAMISSVLVGRTGKQVRDRYLNKLRPNIKLGDWSAEEDERLVALCKEVGNRWSLIATHLPGRTEGQVKNRYYSHIKKRLDQNGNFSQTAESRNNSGLNSFATSPQVEEVQVPFDFGHELDFSMLHGCAMNFANETVVKAPYFTEEEALSEQSTSQGTTSNVDSSSPLRFGSVDPTNVISYDVSENFYGQINHDSQIDEMLSKVTDYYTETKMNVSSDIDAFFSDDLRSEKAFVPESNCDDKLVQLSRRKAYLELALAKTLKEIKGL